MAQEKTNIKDLFFPVLPPNIDGADALAELALDLHWSWNHCADQVWQQLDPVLWDLTNNPWVLLKTISWDKLKEKLSNKEFRSTIDNLVRNKRQKDEAPGWFQKTYPDSPVKAIAYFSMEYMLSEALPIYSGGLGNVAGDQLKSASDLGVPIVAIGLLYQEGYFRQIIDKDGKQEALFPFNDPGQLPITPLRQKNGQWLRIEVPFPGYSIWMRVWEAVVGRRRLLLLDSNDPANHPEYRGITGELYGGGPQLRLKQELLLGIGGWRLLKLMGIIPEVCHLNEGHAAFAVLERAKDYMETTGKSFEESLAITRVGNLFTTHTAVPAGFDKFSPDLIKQFLSAYAQNVLKISMDQLLSLGRINPQDNNEDFNMAYLATRGSGAINGVSKLHGKVSRQIFAPLFPRWPEDEIPIGYVTNGVHMPTWDSAASDQVWEDSCGKSPWLNETESLEKHIRSIPDIKLWQMRNKNRKDLIVYARERLAWQLATRGASHEESEHVKSLFDPNVLTLGFARRFATYKRPNMLLQDPERLLQILTNSKRPVQLIIAGKAHPADKPGQEMIEKWMQFIKRPAARAHVIFLSDYDMQMSEEIVQGVDVWINTPRRPWEACGTSGMKVLVNGGLNLSELDGWWAEAYRPEVGWALGDGLDHGVDPTHDAAEAFELYNLLENQVIPEFYKRDSEGIPIGWIKKVRESMATLTPHFSANRAVREYTEKYYIPAAKNYQERASDKNEIALKLINNNKTLEKNWDHFRFGELTVKNNGNEYYFEVPVYLDEIDPKLVKVELFATSASGQPEHIEMERKRELKGADKTYVYAASVLNKRPANDYTPRVVPNFPRASLPLEAKEILWQR